MGTGAQAAAPDLHPSALQREGGLPEFRKQVRSLSDACLLILSLFTHLYRTCSSFTLPLVNLRVPGEVQVTQHRQPQLLLSPGAPPRSLRILSTDFISANPDFKTAFVCFLSAGDLPRCSAHCWLTKGAQTGQTELIFWLDSKLSCVSLLG